MQHGTASGTPGPAVTLVIHGTFAGQESWWRLGDRRGPSFSDRLEDALARRGVAGTVWRPALDSGMDYEDFRWAGGNRNRDRRDGAHKLGRSLASLAERMKASKDRPLVVNFVAHSHGGNVVLESLRRIPENVVVGNVVLLGTPLISVRPRFQLLRAVISAAFFLFLAAMVFALVLAASIRLSTGSWNRPGDDSMLKWSPLLLLAYGWLFWFLAWVGEQFWIPFSAAWLAWTGRWAGQAYGPGPRALRSVLQGRPLHLFTSHEDEAGLALTLSCAPLRLYEDEVRRRFGRVGRWIERATLYPFVRGLVLDMIAMPMERFVLGFPFFKLAFWDYEMADLDKGRAYPCGSLVKQIDVTNELRIFRSQQRMAVPLPAPDPAAASGLVPAAARRASSLRQTILDVSRSLVEQIKLCHSGYYVSPMVIEQVADAVVDSNPCARGIAGPAIDAPRLRAVPA